MHRPLAVVAGMLIVFFVAGVVLVARSGGCDGGNVELCDGGGTRPGSGELLALGGHVAGVDLVEVTLVRIERVAAAAVASSGARMSSSAMPATRLGGGELLALGGRVAGVDLVEVARTHRAR